MQDILPLQQDTRLQLDGLNDGQQQDLLRHFFRVASSSIDGIKFVNLLTQIQEGQQNPERCIQSIEANINAIDFMLQGNSINALTGERETTPLFSEDVEPVDGYKELYEYQKSISIENPPSSNCIESSLLMVGKQYLYLRQARRRALNSFLSYGGNYSHIESSWNFVSKFDSVVASRLRELSGKQIYYILRETGINIGFELASPDEFTTYNSQDYFEGLKFDFIADIKAFLTMAHSEQANMRLSHA